MGRSILVRHGEGMKRIPDPHGSGGRLPDLAGGDMSPENSLILAFHHY
jgi:hypothetical protein